MVRTRLATLTLAGGLLLTSSGCFGLFERFWRHGAGMDCTCMESGGYGAGMPTSLDGPGSGPVLVSPEPTFTGPPPGAFPQGPPPRIVPMPIPSATPMPWTGQH